MTFGFGSWVNNGDFYPKFSSLVLKMSENFRHNKDRNVFLTVSVIHLCPFISHYVGTAIPCGN